MLAFINNMKNNLNQMWKPFFYKSRLYISQFYKTFALIVGICTGYPFEIIINAFTLPFLNQMSNKNRDCMKVIIIISFFFFIPGDLKEFIFLTKFKKNMFQIKNKSEFSLFGRQNGHYCIFRVTNNTLDITSLTTIKNSIKPGFNVFPYKNLISTTPFWGVDKGIPTMPVQIKNGFQGLAGITRRLNSLTQYHKFFSEFHPNQNPLNFLNLNANNLSMISKYIDNNNIIIHENDLEKVTQDEALLLENLLKIEILLPEEEIKRFWIIFQKPNYTKEILFQETLRSFNFTKTIPELYIVNGIQKNILSNFSGYGFSTNNNNNFSNETFNDTSKILPVIKREYNNSKRDNFLSNAIEDK